MLDKLQIYLQLIVDYLLQIGLIGGFFHEENHKNRNEKKPAGSDSDRYCETEIRKSISGAFF